MRKLYPFEKWLMKRYGGNSALESINTAVDSLLIKSNQSELPIKLSQIASLIGVNPSPIYKDQIFEGELIEINNELRICLKMKSERSPSNSWSGLPRMRFTYAHELIHCLSYDFSTSQPKRIAPLPENKEEEVLCNHGASRLLLPPKITMRFLKQCENKEFVSIAKQIALKAKVSLHLLFLQLFKINYFDTLNKIFMLSSINKGLRGRNKEKPRCIISVINFQNGKNAQFLPGYMGIESIESDWSLVRLYSMLLENKRISELEVNNEIITYKNLKYLINGKHKKIENSSYIWTDVDFKRI